MSIYDITFSNQAEQNIPPDYRGEKQKSWLKALLSPLQWLRDAIFVDYRNGFSGADFNILTAYAKGVRVRYTDNSVYETILPTTAGILPTNKDYWYKVNDVFIGLIPRMYYNSQQLLFEYILNQWFRTTFRQPTTEVNEAGGFYLPKSDIYIIKNTVDNLAFGVTDDVNITVLISQTESIATEMIGDSVNFSSIHYTIMIPIAVYNALATTNQQRTSIVKSQVDKYNLAGITYEITTY